MFFGQGGGVSVKTPNSCGYYRYILLVITITELRYAALTLTPLNIEKGFYSFTKNSLTRNWTQNLQHAEATEAHRQIVPNAFVNNYIICGFERKEKRNLWPVVSRIFWCFELFPGGWGEKNTLRPDKKHRVRATHRSCNGRRLGDFLIIKCDYRLGRSLRR